jgi:hypothetical protein
LGFRKNRNEQAREIEILEDGSVRITDIREGPSPSRSSIIVRGTDVDGFVTRTTAAGIHTHPRTGDKATDQANELPGPGDHVLLETHQIPSFIVTPSGQIRVLESIGGKFKVRTLFGTDAPGQAEWKPGTCNSKGECSFD